jgi:hypothetical protein
MPASRIHLKLFLADASPDAKAVRRRFTDMLQHLPKKSYTFRVILPSQNPELCEREKIFCLPTLDLTIKPNPTKRFIGDLKEEKITRYIARMLGVYEKVFSDEEEKAPGEKKKPYHIEAQINLANNSLSGHSADRQPSAGSQNLRDIIVKKKRG